MELDNNFGAYYANIPDAPPRQSRVKSIKENPLPLLIWSILKALINNIHLIYQTVIYGLNLFDWKYDNSSKAGVQFGMALGLTICNFLLHLARLRNKFGFNFHMNAFIVSIFWQLFISLFTTGYTGEAEKQEPTYDNQYFYNWIHIFIQCNHLSKVHHRESETDDANAVNKPLWHLHFENLKKAFIRANHLIYQILEAWLLYNVSVIVEWPFKSGCSEECKRGGRFLFLIVLFAWNFVLHFIRLEFQYARLRGWQIGLYWIAASASVTGDVYMTFYLVDYDEDKATENTNPEMRQGQILALINHILSLLSPAWKPRRRISEEDENKDNMIQAMEMVEKKKKKKKNPKKEKKEAKTKFSETSAAEIFRKLENPESP
jgi:hypothetical protein